MSDWMPKWPKRKTVNQLTVSGLDDEVQFSKVPDRYAKGGLNKSAPAVLSEHPKGYPGSNMAEKFTLGKGNESDDEYYDTSDEFSPVIIPKHSTPYQGNKDRKIITNGVGNIDRRLRPEAKEWVPDRPRVAKKAKSGGTVETKFDRVELGAPSNYGNDYYQMPRGNDYLPERVGYRNKMTERPNRRKQCDPDKFDGEKIDWTDYLKHFETVSDWNNWSYREKGMQLAMSLRGQAQRVLGDLSFYGAVEDFDSLVKELTRRFSPVERETSYRLEFRNRVRQSQESVMQFGYALRRLASEAFPSIPNDCQEQWVLDQFVIGLNNHELKKHVQFGHPKNLNEAIALALEYESFESGDSKYRSKPGKCHTVGVADDQGKADNQVLRDICSMVQNSTKELQSIKKVVQKPPVDSGKGQGQRTGRSNQKTSDKPNLSNVQCFKCKEYGHYQKYCPLGKSGPGSSKIGESKTKLN